jgi:hypothetical protein
MPRYNAFDPATELTGMTVMALIVNIHHADIAPILERHGLDRVDPQRWYPLQSVLNVLSDVSENPDAMANFVSIGMAAANIGYNALADSAKKMSLDQFFTLYGQVYQERHRGDAGYVTSDKLNNHHLVIRMKIPYPDDLYYGVIYGYVRQFLSRSKTPFSLKYDETQPRRDQGGEETIVHVLIDG